MDISAVCFDIDGTLYPHRATLLRLIGSIFPSPRLAFHYQRFRSRIRRQPQVETIPADREGFRRRQTSSILKTMGKKPTQPALARMEARIERQMYASWRSTFAQLTPYPGVREAFEMIRSYGLRIGVLSDFPVERKLETLKVADLVDVSCCTEDCGYLKPNTAPFFHIARKMGVECHQVLYVGDSYRKDVVGASQAGMYTCLIVPKRLTRWLFVNLRKRFPLADMICTDYKEFEELFKTKFHGGI